MSESAFASWKQQVQSLDPLARSEDCEAFLALLTAVEGRLDGPMIDVLLDTFSNADDHGVQERVMVVLDSANPVEYASRLAGKFHRLIDCASEKEWPLTLLGRILNTADPLWVEPLLEAAKHHPPMHAFIRSDAFLEEYPEVELLLQKAGI